ncbi:MAG: hypothetical protein KAT00_15380 [Planctomycetes bacterium]|nr:hypothetical protein [Planctomycetota bacterium]
MRVHIYKPEDGEFTILLEPAVGRGLHPVLVHGVTTENVKEQVGPLVDKMRGGKFRPSDGI